ncbi:MAG TPA: malto-oligosyltrehalose synthase [Vicinamibacterales bacterium]|nr:malto-oligosyltrehalose synthase [Vicinamibacterales bacterium]
MSPAVIPAATYRLQFNKSFTFDDATAIVDYLDRLGISHCYASSYFKAVPGSTHGYDVADPTQLNPEIGDRDQYDRWVAALRAHRMGHIIDLVPNHMGIAQSCNPWWQDVLENGPSSQFASFFDIDWHPLKQELTDKVLLPILGGSYGAVLERQEITLQYVNGAFTAHYFNTVLPIAPGTYDRILALDAGTLLAEIGEGSDEGQEFLSILTAIRHLPARDAQTPDARAERHRETEVIKRRLARQTGASPAVLAHIRRAVMTLNGSRGDARSFDRLDELLSVQPYRLAYWRVAAEEINYRRFFDINELAALRMEDPEVFERTHAFAFELLREGAIDGLRIDHVDGLYDPGDYLERLQARAREVRPDLFTGDRRLYLVVEKILGLDEWLPAWPVEGTTGYEFLVRVNGLFVDVGHERAVNEAFERFTRLRAPFREFVYRSKQLVLRMSMASELQVLAHGLNRFSERNRHYRDFTLNLLVYAMREIIAAFPVYRTYVNGREPDVTAHDRRYIEYAVTEAKRRNARHPGVVFDFIRGLLLKKADYIPEEDRGEHMKFVSKFQQVTSPVTAKGIEDTALYIYNRLVSLNEVGGEPDKFGITADALHGWLAERAKRWPHSLSASSTHDTKRSEDVRARINILSELPADWRQATGRWARMNRKARVTIDGESYPSRNEEYLLYQTLVGTWPARPMTPDGEREYQERIGHYMLKTMREAKVFTSWLNPSEPHEQAMGRFVEMVLSPSNIAFRRDFVEFASRVARHGVYNSLAQLAIKIGAPGVPDFYQGTELWDFSLVDPDNRRPVDYARRRELLDALPAPDGSEPSLVSELLAHPEDDRLKLFASTTMLRARRAAHDVFRCGSYEPLAVEGSAREHVFAFARVLGQRQAIVAVPRLVATLRPDGDAPIGDTWRDTRIAVPDTAPRCYRQAFTGACASVIEDGGRRWIRAADAFAHFPIAFLEAP